LLAPALAFDASTISAAPALGGAYVLLIRLDAPLSVVRRGNERSFAPGWYAYAGSANGPGGLRARLARHLRKDKRPHWHVDPLTMAAARIAAFALPSAVECELADRLAASGAFRHVGGGFGSSDCRRCPSHLLSLAGSGAGQRTGL